MKELIVVQIHEGQLALHSPLVESTDNFSNLLLKDIEILANLKAILPNPISESKKARKKL